MKKISVLLIMSMLIVGMFSTGIVLADRDDSGLSANARVSIYGSANSDDSDYDDDGEDDEDDSYKSENRIRVKSSSDENGLEIRSRLEIRNQNGEDDESRIRVRASNGDEVELRVLPTRAAEIARERLRANNVSIEIRERSSERNEPRVVYHAEADRPGKFLGIFKIRARYEASIDAETGEVVEFNGPWWAFLITSDVDAEIDAEGEVESEADA